MFPFKTRRSAGVPVTPGVHRLLSQANAHRDGRRWEEAAALYRRALRRDPRLAHVWVQLGHMLKEAGDLPGAGDAYERAAALSSLDAEPLLQLARLHWRAGRPSEAARIYERAFAAAPGSAVARAGLRRAVGLASEADRERLIGLLLGHAAAEREPHPAESAGPGDGSHRELLLDVGDLLEFWFEHRLPTGIQRVQLQLLLSAMDLPDVHVAPCAFIPGAGEFKRLATTLIAHAARASLQGEDAADPAWTACLDRLHVRLARTPPLSGRRGDVLLSAGSAWDMPGFFTAIHELKRRDAVSYLPLVYDLTPLKVPQFFTAEARDDFARWAPRMLAEADGAVAISEATKRDLVAVSRDLASPIAAASVAVLPLDVDTRLEAAGPPSAGPERWGLSSRSYVLFVATVEPRKGHAVALDAWSRLIASHGAQAVPQLVCAGRRGWMSDDIYRRVREDPELAARVTFTGALSDPELDRLYAECLFTIYPSHYEGWGLPVTESLCHGRAVITTSSSSLPEAGGAFAVYAPPGDAEALAEAAARLIFDAPFRSGIEARIARDHRPVGWPDLVRRLRAACFAPPR